MKYAFKDMLNAELYSSKVVFVFGKYSLFSNLVCDEFKNLCNDESVESNEFSNFISKEFGLDDDSDDNISNSVDFNTFMEVNNIPSINGKWFCKVSLSSLTKKQKEQLDKYMKEPSDNGILVIVSSEWKEYREYLKNRKIIYSKVTSMIQLDFPNRDVLKEIVTQLFEERDIEISKDAVDFFIIRLSSEYDKYEEVIDGIKEIHGTGKLEIKDIRSYMKGIEYFNIEDLVYEMVKPMSSDKTNKKKVLKIARTLEDSIGAKNLIYKLLMIVEQSIDIRVHINKGNIPVGINYFYKDVIENVGGKDSKLGKLNEWVFRKQVDLASRTSLKDWQYIYIILSNALSEVRLTDVEMEQRCERAIYDACTRSVLTSDRVNNIIGIDNVLNKDIKSLDKIKYEEEIKNG